MLPVGARDAEEDRRPAPEAELAFGLELAREDEMAVGDPVIGAFDLRDAVHEDLEWPGHIPRQTHARSLAHSFFHAHRMAALVRSKLLLTGGALVALALALAASAAAGNGGFAPVPPESPNAGGITDAWWLITFFIAAPRAIMFTYLTP